MIGRKEEQEVLRDCLASPRPEFLAMYGRRRVGKTYLIREFFNDCFSFYATGVPNLNTRKQLRIFNESLLKYGSTDKTIPGDWLEAFSRLEKLLSSPDVQRDYQSGKRVVFLDELPWLDTARSDFKSALDYFWNSWGSAQKDLVFIVCGSATSWMIRHVVMNTGGLYNRITRQIHLLPFSLGECEQLLQSNGMPFTRRQIMECYMVFGGVPYYLNYLKPQLSLAQNVDALLFQENSPLRHEYTQLFASLFRNAGHHMEITEALSRKSSGLTRTELSQQKNIPDGKELTRCLEELEQCGFIRKYSDFTRAKNSCIYQLTDPFTLFQLTWVQNRKLASWVDFINTPAYYSWCGIAFERVCMLHSRQMKLALGISGISSRDYAWRSKKSSPGAQIDLLIDRKDDVINLCEMKYTQDEYVIDAAYEKELLSKMETFRKESGTQKAILLTMVAINGVKQNAHRGIVMNEIVGNDLFRDLI